MPHVSACACPPRAAQYTHCHSGWMQGLGVTPTHADLAGGCDARPEEVCFWLEIMELRQANQWCRSKIRGSHSALNASVWPWRHVPLGTSGQTG